MLLLYRLVTGLYFIGIWLAAPFVPKARKWVQGRKNWRDALASFSPGEQTVWIHAASLGEFEQGRPIIEEIRADFPGTKIVLSFFSPSGYEVRKNYPHADRVVYLPADSPANARTFLDHVKPTLAIFIKYELWYYYLAELARRKVPALLVSAHYPKGHRYGRGLQQYLFRKLIRLITHVFAQTPETADVLQQMLPQARVTVSGDTRFDRVLDIAENFRTIPTVAQFIQGRFTVVAGSTWPVDEALLLEAFDELADPDLVLVLAPHNLHEDDIDSLIERYRSRALRFSELEDIEPEPEHQILIIDNIGMLSRLYHYGDLCYIGGGQGAGIHNILEAAVYGQRILFGPNYQRFQEAVDLVAAKGAAVVRHASDLKQEIASGREKSPEYLHAQDVTYEYVRERTGATDAVMAYISERKLLQHLQTIEADEPFLES